MRIDFKSLEVERLGICDYISITDQGSFRQEEDVQEKLDWFLSELYKCDFMNWADRYFAPVENGTHWNVQIEYDTYCQEKSGSNHFPPKWNKFCKAVSKLRDGEFYTPHEVSQVLAKVVTIDAADIDNQFRVYDPTMGSGSLLLTVQKELTNGDEGGSVEFYGQELNTTTYNLARMNLMMHGVNYRNMELKRADTLEADWPFAEKDGTQIPLKFDAVVVNPPYSQNWDIKNVDREKDTRFKGYGVAPASKADYAFVLHGLYHLDKAGTMAIVLPHGVLFRGASEGKIRKNIIDNNMLDTVIGLPANLFYGTSIPTCVLVFKGREARKNKDILFIDASNEFEKGKNQNKLSPENINKIIETYCNRVDVEKYAHVASLDEIKENDYNLNIPRYVDTFEEEVIPLSQVAQELTEVKADIANSYDKLFELLNELNGTTDEAKNELSKFISLLGK